MIRLCAQSFGCLNLIGWVYKWEYEIWDDSWWCELWISRCPTWSPLEQMETPRWQPSIRCQSRTGNMQWRAWQFFSFIFFLQFCICFFYQGQHSINARMQHILSIKFVVVFEIALTWWVMTPFYHSSCCCACDRSMVAILPFIQTRWKQKHKQRKENTDLTKKSLPQK